MSIYYYLRAVSGYILSSHLLALTRCSVIKHTSIMPTRIADVLKSQAVSTISKNNFKSLFFDTHNPPMYLRLPINTVSKPVSLICGRPCLRNSRDHTARRVTARRLSRLSPLERFHLLTHLLATNGDQFNLNFIYEYLQHRTSARLRHHVSKLCHADVQGCLCIPVCVQNRGRAWHDNARDCVPG